MTQRQIIPSRGPAIGTVTAVETRVILDGRTKQIAPGNYRVKGTLLPFIVDEEGRFHIDWHLERV